MIPYEPYPILFELGQIKIYTYGLFFALGALLGLYFAGKHAEKVGYKKEDIYDVGIWVVLLGIFFARLFYVIQFGGNFFKINEGGLVFYGGLFGGILAIFLVTRRKKLNFFGFLDLVVPYLALGHAIARIGCYFRGCCYGLPMETVMPWAVEYLGALRHPTQLYSVIANLLVFVILINLRKSFKKTGLLFSSYLMIYPLFRFIVEFFRDEPAVVFGLSIAQVISVCMLLIGVGFFLFFYKDNLSKIKKNRRKRKS